MKSFSQTKGAQIVEEERPERIDKDSLIGVPFTVVRYEDTFSEQFGNNCKITIIIPDDKYLEGFTKTGEKMFAPQTIYGGKKLNQQLHEMDLKEDFPFMCTLVKNEWNAHEFSDMPASDMTASEVPF